jgi:membrane protein implicated in regulation of membrane protease activity
MKLETIALALVVIFAALWLGTFVTGLLTAIPYGVFGLIPVAIVLALLVEVIRQRLANKEDDYYDKNVDK